MKNHITNEFGKKTRPSGAGGLVIINYGAGNIQSIKFAIKRLGYEAILSHDVEEIKAADKVIFPGVGEASSAMNKLRASGLDKIIPKLKQPVLGICLGMQLMCNASEEGNTKGLGIFDVDVVGGLNIKKYYGDEALAVFVQPPSVEELRKRLKGRETETEEKIQMRVAKAEHELSFASEFDVVLINDNLEVAFAEAEKIIAEFIKSTKKDYKVIIAPHNIDKKHIKAIKKLLAADFIILKSTINFYFQQFIIYSSSFIVKKLNLP